MNNSLEKPIPPADDDCCGGGACDPCVWDRYNDQMRVWRLAQVKLKEAKLLDDSPDSDPCK